jgi:hypothetical protein
MEPQTRYGRGNVRPAPMPVDELRALLAYDPATGLLTWKDCPAGGQGAKRVKVGDRAGTKTTFGYLVIRVRQILYPAHRLAWYLHTGQWAPEQIDHINEDKADNRLVNLRLASKAENTRYAHQNRIARNGGPKPDPVLMPITVKNDRVSVARVRNLLAYNPDTGDLIWRVDMGCNAARIPAGSIAGSRSPDNGYSKVKIDGYLAGVHRVAWVLMTGEWPSMEVDHINGERGDNRWCNLRIVSRGQNQHNRAGNRPSSTGFRGVSRNGRGFKAQININGKLIAFPTRPTAEEAHADYVAAARLQYGEFARTD